MSGLNKESSSKTSDIDMSQKDRSTESLETSGILCVNEFIDIEDQ